MTTKEVEDLLARLPEMEARADANCQFCGLPATCLGEYETCTGVDTFACDSCCGHGNEDGHCTVFARDDRTLLISAVRELKAQRDSFEEQVHLHSKDWAEDDTEIKRLAETVGVHGESTDDYFRPAVEVVADLVKKLRELIAQRDALVGACDRRIRYVDNQEPRRTQVERDIDNHLRQALALTKHPDDLPPMSEFICPQCGLRQDSKHPKTHEF